MMRSVVVSICVSWEARDHLHRAYSRGALLMMCSNLRQLPEACLVPFGRVICRYAIGENSQSGFSSH